jgi:hypothetical protein
MENTQQIIEDVQNMISQKDWHLINSNSAITLETKLLSDNNLKCYRVNAIIMYSPEQVCNFLWTCSDNDWKELDSDIEFRQTFNQDINSKSFYQIIKSPQPFLSRDMLITQYKIETKDTNAFWIISFSTKNDYTFPTKNKYVRADIKIQVYGFIPYGVFTQIWCFSQIDYGGYSFSQKILDKRSKKLQHFIIQIRKKIVESQLNIQNFTTGQLASRIEDFKITNFKTIDRHKIFNAQISALV